MHVFSIVLITCSLLLGVTIVHAQDDIDAAADSLLRGEEGLFDEPQLPDSLLGPAENSLTARRGLIHTPEFSIRYDRADLLGLHDRYFYISYDRADGLYLGYGADLAKKHFLERRLQGYIGGGYAFGSHYWQVMGGLKRDFFSEQSPLRVGAETHIITDTKDAWKMGLIENSIAAIVAGVDARDYFQRRGFSFSMQQFFTPRVSLSAEYHWDNYRNSRREVGFSIFGPSQPFREVPAVREGPIKSIVIDFLADYLSLRTWSAPQLGLEAQMEFGFGDYSFQQLVADARMKATLVDEWVWLAVHMRGGSASGDAPPQKLFTIGGFGTLPGYPQNEYEGNRMALLQTDVLIAPFHRLPNLRLIFSNDVGAVSNAPSEASLLGNFPGLDLFKYSTGIYIGTPAARLRIGAAWRTDVRADPVFVLRLGQVF